jgi:hypothetical protein
LVVLSSEDRAISSSGERMTEWRRRQRERGLVPVEVWVPKDRSAEIAALAKSWCPAPPPAPPRSERVDPLAPGTVLVPALAIDFREKPPRHFRDRLVAAGWQYAGTSHVWIVVVDASTGINETLVRDAHSLGATVKRVALPKG